MSAFYVVAYGTLVAACAPPNRDVVSFGPMVLPSARALVGRTAERDGFDRALDAIGEGRPSAIYLTGEPGIGKTALIGDCLRRAEERGFRTCSGRATEFESAVPFAVVADALD